MAHTQTTKYLIQLLLLTVKMLINLPITVRHDQSEDATKHFEAHAYSTALAEIATKEMQINN